MDTVLFRLLIFYSDGVSQCYERRLRIRMPCLVISEETGLSPLLDAYLYVRLESLLGAHVSCQEESDVRCTIVPGLSILLDSTGKVDGASGRWERWTTGQRRGERGENLELRGWNLQAWTTGQRLAVDGGYLERGRGDGQGGGGRSPGDGRELRMGA
jgi:hypothetical protein